MSKTPLTDQAELWRSILTNQMSGVADYWLAGLFLGGLCSLVGGAAGFLAMLVFVIVLDRIEQGNGP